MGESLHSRGSDVSHKVMPHVIATTMGSSTLSAPNDNRLSSGSESPAASQSSQTSTRTSSFTSVTTTLDSEDDDADHNALSQAKIAPTTIEHSPIDSAHFEQICLHDNEVRLKSSLKSCAVVRKPSGLFSTPRPLHHLQPRAAPTAMLHSIDAKKSSAMPFSEQPKLRSKGRHSQETAQILAPHAISDLALDLHMPRSGHAPMQSLTNKTPSRSHEMSIQEPYRHLPGFSHSSIPTDHPRFNMRRPTRNKSTGSLAIRAMSNCNRSRSPSPQAQIVSMNTSDSSAFSSRSHQSASVRPRHLAPMSSKQHSRSIKNPRSSNPRLPLRVGSKPRARRSAKEIEAEYNDNSDEDLPEDASLWNVPLSPRPQHERDTTSSSPAGPSHVSTSAPGSTARPYFARSATVTSSAPSSPATSAPSPTSLCAPSVPRTAPTSPELPGQLHRTATDIQSSPSSSPNTSISACSGSRSILGTMPASVHRTSPKMTPRASPDRPSPLRASMGSDGQEVIVPKITSSSKGLSSSLNTHSPHLRILPGRRTLPADFSSSPTAGHRRLLHRGASTGMMDNASDVRRVQSWNVAMAQLCPEAQDLTVALEQLETNPEHSPVSPKLEVSSTNPGIDISDSDVKQAGTTSQLTRAQSTPTSIVTLPPLCKNNESMLDPLPVSKEKAKVLSHTRPSWLPPKCKKEEERHQREYQRMVSTSQEAERRRIRQEARETALTANSTGRGKPKKANSCENETPSEGALLGIWEEHVLPNWDRVIREPRTRELWWRGIGAQARGKVWLRAVGNELGITEITWERALERAKSVQEIRSASQTSFESCLDAGSVRELETKQKAYIGKIAQSIRELATSCPSKFGVYQTGTPLHAELLNLVVAYILYCLGSATSDLQHASLAATNLVPIAAFLHIHLDHNPYNSFLVLANLMNRPLPAAFLPVNSGQDAEFHEAGRTKAYDLCVGLLTMKNPELAKWLFGPSNEESVIFKGDQSMTPVYDNHIMKPNPASDNISGASISSPSLRLLPSDIFRTLLESLFLIMPRLSNEMASSLAIDPEVTARIWDVMVFDGDSTIIRTAVATVLDILGGHEISGRKDEDQTKSSNLDREDILSIFSSKCSQNPDSNQSPETTPRTIDNSGRAVGNASITLDMPDSFMAHVRSVGRAS